MSGFDAATRAQVVARAGDRCEYCRLPQAGQAVTFPIDHVTPLSAGGTSSPENYALACPHCNSHKWAHQTGVDPLSGVAVMLYHPRLDIWADHFEWSAQVPEILVGRTDRGRATINRLRMNHERMPRARRLLIEAGRFP